MDRDYADFDFERLRSHPLYFYVGAGVSQSSGLLGWAALVHAVEQYRKHYETWPEEVSPGQTANAQSAYLQRFVTEEAILAHGSLDDRAFGRLVLLNILLRHRPGEAGTMPELITLSADDLHSLIWTCWPHGVFTTNYDVLAERACPPTQSADLRVYRYFAGFLPYILSNPRFVLKLHGDVNDIATMLFDPVSAWSSGGALASDAGAALIRLVQEVCSAGHVIFVGTSFRDETIKRLDTAFSSKYPDDRYRIALIREDEIKAGSEVAELRRQGYFSGVSFLTYSGSADDAAKAFLSGIARHRPQSSRNPPCPAAHDIWLNAFTDPPFKRSRRWRTEPWTLKSECLTDPKSSG